MCGSASRAAIRINCTTSRCGITCSANSARRHCGCDLHDLYFRSRTGVSEMLVRAHSAVDRNNYSMHCSESKGTRSALAATHLSFAHRPLKHSSPAAHVAFAFFNGKHIEPSQYVSRAQLADAQLAP